jgi:NADH-quinone oxidoreductase subunit J
MEMMIYSAVFLLTVAFALGVLFNNDTVRSAISLVGVMICLAVNFLLMRQEFVAAIQVVVYAGAIMVLFLFVIMLLSLKDAEKSPHYMRSTRFWGGVVGIIFFFVLAVGIQVFAVSMGKPGALETEVAIAEGGVPEVILISIMLMTKYIAPFLLTSVLLLVAVIGAIVMARRKDDDGNEIVLDQEAL